MRDQEWLAERFEEQRPRLRQVAYRMLGSLAEAEDAVQDAWLRASRAGADGVENLDGWLTTVVARVCLNLLRSRQTRREEPLDVHVPDPVVSFEADPEQAALLGDAVGLALLVVLDTLSPAERVAFVLHDMFAVPFGEIARLLETSAPAARQLASRGRRRIRAAAKPEGALESQREVVDAFFAAARNGDFETLVSLLDPDIVLRSDGGAARPRLTAHVEGAAAVAGRALQYANPAARLHPLVVNGGAGVLVTLEGRPFSLLAFTVSGGRIVEIDAIADPERVRRILDAPSARRS
ncbi:MAG TPA: sigma-70 family RNA polymerase sigma factor [Gaiellaceae bacterium]|nr:sigma-70 family RNA polymerase sigma factor [Gaiellaceae bacterium]